MTGPERGWYFDPDDREAERYWNGDAWTDHRRARDPVATSGSLEPQPTEAPDPEAALNAGEPRRRRSVTRDERRGAKVRNDSKMTTPPQPRARKAQRGQVVAAGDEHFGQIGVFDPGYQDDLHIFMKFEGDQDLYAFEHGEIEVVTGAPTAVLKASKPQEPRGTHARVVASGDEHQERIGLIDPTYEDEEHVFLRFEGDQDLYAYERHEIELVVGPPAVRHADTTTTATEAGPTAPSPGANDTLPSKTSDRDATAITRPQTLHVGAQAKVVVADKRYKGRVGTIAAVNGNQVSLTFDRSLGTYSFPRSHVELVAAPWSQELGPTTPTAPHTPVQPPSETKASPSPSTELTVGDRAKVVMGDRRYVNRIGTVASLDGDVVDLRLKGSFGTLTFRRNHVVGIAAERGPRNPGEAPSLAKPDSATPLQRFWVGLPTAGRVAVVVVPALVLLGVVAAVVSANSRDAASYRYGHDALSPEAATLASVGVGGDAKYRCEQAYTIQAGIGNASKFVRDDVLAGCVDGVGK